MRIRSLSVRALASAAALLISAACAGRSGARDTEVAPAEVPLDQLVLEVENHNWSDVVVSLVHDGSRSRFTQVTAGAQASLPIPRHLVGQSGLVRVSVHPIGTNQDFTSEAVSLRTGSTLRLTVESRVARSSVAVW